MSYGSYECRFCLTENADELKIQEIEESIIQKVEKLTSLKMSEDDKLPKTCCLNCIKDINQAYQTRENIIEAYNTFLQKLKENVKPCIEIDPLEEKILPLKKSLSSDNLDISDTVVVAENFISPCKSDVTPFETIFLSESETKSTATTSNLKTLPKLNDNKVVQKGKEPQFPILKNENTAQLHLQKLHPQRIQQQHQKLLQQHKLHLDRIQLQQQRLLKIPLNNQKRQFEMQKLQVLQKQKLIIQQKMRVLANVFRQSFHALNNKNKASSVVHPKRPAVFERKNEFPKKCEICNELCSDYYVYKLHSKKHQSKTCDICHTTVRSDNFKKHMDNVHKDDPAVCEICGKVAKNKESLRGHMYYIHSNKRSYKCEHCGKDFQSKHGYLHHVKKAHLGIRNHQCDICGKKFYSKYDVKKHINMTHNGARPHICPFCKKGFSSTNARKVHMRQHTLETPYKCEECGGGFRQKVSLKTHMKSKHNINLKEVDSFTEDMMKAESSKIKSEVMINVMTVVMR